MDVAAYFPMWDKLAPEDQQLLRQSAIEHTAPKGTLLHSGEQDCMGLLLIRSGQLRAYLLSEEGREVTLYRLFDWDICLFAASCMMQSIQFNVFIEAEKDTEMLVIPPSVYKMLLDRSAPVANYTNQLMAERFSEIMWTVEQVLWKSFDKRLAGFLLEESLLEEDSELKITHEKIANHLGTAREVVTRMLRYFQSEGMVKLNRGTVELTDEGKLRRLRDS